jgi:CelD/BcsL family acetyltransferase involved in cellulose biosynthesis
MNSAAGFETRLHTRLSEIDADHWDRLSARPPASINASRAWAEAAFETVDCKARPFLVGAWDGSRLAGLLPLAEREKNGRPVLSFPGAPHNDMTDLLALPGRGHEAAGALLTSLPAVAGDRELDLDELDPDGALARADSGLEHLAWSRSDGAPAIDLRSAWELAASRHRRCRWDSEMRSLRRNHAVEPRWIERGDATAALPRFVRMREARLLAKGRPLDLPPIPLLEAAVARLAPAGRCALIELLIDGAPAATDLYLLDRPVAMAWLRALDSRWSKYSCGHLLLRETARELTASGYTVLDLGRGEEPYKYLFGARSRALLRARSIRSAPE